MDERIRPTRSGLFAIELLISVGVFTLCAAICISLFVRSDVMSRDSADLIRAVNEARSVAECYKAAGGDPDRTASLCGAQADTDGRILLKFDGGWNRVTDGPETFQLYLTPNAAEGVDDEPGTSGAVVSVVREGTERLLSWEIAAWEVAS